MSTREGKELRSSLLLFSLLTIMVLLSGNTALWLINWYTAMFWSFFISLSKVDHFHLHLKSLLQTLNKLESTETVKMPIFKPLSRMLTISTDKQQQKSENIWKFSSFQSSIQGQNNVDKIIPDHSRNDAFY